MKEMPWEFKLLYRLMLGADGIGIKGELSKCIERWKGRKLNWTGNFLRHYFNVESQ